MTTVSKRDVKQTNYGAILVKDIGWVKKPEDDYIYTYYRGDTMHSSTRFLVGRKTFFVDSVLGFEEL